jgi:predicted metal-dependent HD superfamily phosphohydrolase
VPDQTTTPTPISTSESAERAALGAAKLRGPELGIEEAIEAIDALSERAYKSITAWPHDAGYDTNDRKAREAYAALGAALASSAGAFRRAVAMLEGGSL